MTQVELKTQVINPEAKTQALKTAVHFFYQKLFATRAKCSNTIKHLFINGSRDTLEVNLLRVYEIP